MQSTHRTLRNPSALCLSEHTQSRAHTQVHPAATMSTNYEDMKVDDLKELLKARGLSVGGRKQELIERLVREAAHAH